MKKRLKEIADYIGGQVEGDAELQITGLAGIEDAGPGQLSFVANEKYAARAQESSASALIVPLDLRIDGAARLGRRRTRKRGQRRGCDGAQQCASESARHGCSLRLRT